MWTPRTFAPEGSRGVTHYERLVALCRRFAVLTPEDAYARWPGAGPPRAIVPLFLLDDYSFAPDGVHPDDAVTWAAQSGVRSADEDLLAPDPQRQPCVVVPPARRRRTGEAGGAAAPDVRLVLVNHFPLRRDLAVLPRIPRFTIWCGPATPRLWHQQFNVEAVVYGHLHIMACVGSKCDGPAPGFAPRRRNDGSHLEGCTTYAALAAAAVP